MGAGRAARARLGVRPAAIAGGLEQRLAAAKTRPDRQTVAVGRIGIDQHQRQHLAHVLPGVRGQMGGAVSAAETRGRPALAGRAADQRLQCRRKL